MGFMIKIMAVAVLGVALGFALAHYGSVDMAMAFISGLAGCW